MLAAAAVLLALVAAPLAVADDPNRVTSEAELEALGIAEAAVSAPPVVPAQGQWSWNYGPYRYDGSGNIASIGTQVFLYDTRGRLTSATIDRPDQQGAEQQTYLYDPFGNMTTRTGAEGTVSLPTSAATNHLMTVNAQYDAGGNMTQWQAPGNVNTYRYTYDALNALHEVKRTNLPATNGYLYVYTADEERIWTYDRTANLSHWKIRDLAGRVVRDYVDNGMAWSVSRDYIYYDGTLLAAVTPTETLHFSLDHLGTPRVMTNDTAVRVGFHHYYPFGGEWTVPGTQKDEPMKFTGHERDADPTASSNELDYMHARYYGAVMGRFLSVDPLIVEEAVDAPQLWNRYTYVGDSPVIFTDPFGLDRSPWEWLKDRIQRVRKQKTAPGAECEECIRYGVTPDITVTAKDPGTAFEKERTVPLSYRIIKTGGAADILEGIMSGDPRPVIRGTIKEGEIATSLVIGGGGPRELTVPVSRWGRAGLREGDWVMRGRSSFWNYLKSGKWDPARWNEFARPGAGQDFAVAAWTLKAPMGLGKDGILKAILGQRLYMSLY